MRITTVIITYNEGHNIEKCLDSVCSFSDEVIIVDSFSTDDTREKALKYNNVRFVERAFDDYISQKNYANNLTQAEYIFSIDADEWCSEAMAESLKNSKNELPELMSFRRKNYYCGRIINYGTWNPDVKIRLWKKELAHWGGTIPHEHLVYEPSNTVIHSDFILYHNAYLTISSHFNKSLKYARMASRHHLKDKSFFTLCIKMLMSPIVKFFKGFVLKMGVLNGLYGWILEFIVSFETFYKYYLALKYKINKSWMP